MDLIKQQIAQGGIIPSQLDIGTKILLEMYDYVYEIDKKDNYLFEVTSADPLIGREPLDVIFIDSELNAWSMKDWIGRGMAISFKTPYGSVMKPRDTVKSAKVIGETYEFGVWD